MSKRGRHLAGSICLAERDPLPRVLYLRHRRHKRTRIRRVLAGLYLLLSVSSCAPAQPTISPDEQIAAPACVGWRVQDDRNYLFFFDHSSAALTTRAKSILTELARRWNVSGGRFLELAGHTDRDEARVASPSLGLQRAQAAKDFLVAQGVDPQRIIVENFAATRVLVNNEQREPQNRRVEPRPWFNQSEEERLAYLRRLMCRNWVSDHCFTPSRLAHAGATACTAALNAAVDR